MAGPVVVGFAVVIARLHRAHAWRERMAKQ